MNIETVAKYALQIRKDPHKHILMIGHYLSGATMIARRVAIPAIDQAKTEEDERRIVSASAPFRAPHHTTSAVAIRGTHGKSTPCGAMLSPCRPGEIALAHGGVLFMDQINEFESLAQSHVIDAIANDANIRVIGFMYPCPCGFKGWNGSGGPICKCSDRKVMQHNLLLAPRLRSLMKTIELVENE